MEDKNLELCKEIIAQKGKITRIPCDGICVKCIFWDDKAFKDCTEMEPEKIIHIAKDYIGKHNKTANTINSIEEQTITLDDLKDIKENNIVPTYYHKGNYDVIQFCNDNDIDFTTGNIIKYITSCKGTKWSE